MAKIQYINHISEIPNLKDARFIANILTSWQFDVALAYIQSHNLTNGILIVEAVPFANPVKFRLTEEQVSLYSEFFDSIFFCKNRKHPYNVQNMIKFLFSRKTKKTLILLRPLPHISLRLLSNIIEPKRNVHYVALDEGLSSYATLFDSLKVMYSNTFIVIKKWFIQNVLNTIGALFIKTKEDFGLFYYKHLIFSPNIEACAALRELYYGRISPKYSNKKCIFIFKDYWIIPDEQAIFFVQGILDHLKCNDFDIIIKKHPSDTSQCFDDAILSKHPNVTIINSMQSGEELVAAYKPCVIVGGYSNVVFSSAYIFQIPVISHSLIYVSHHLTSSSIEYHIKYLAHQLNDHIFFCQDMTEVNNKLSEIIQQ